MIMKIFNRMKTGLSLLIVSAMLMVSCNKDLEQFPSTPAPVPTGSTIGETLRNTDTDSLFYRLILKSGTATLATLNNAANRYTLFVPDNNAMKIFINAASGGLIPLAAPDAVFSGFITANISAANATSIVNYNIVPQIFTTAQIIHNFPNLELPTSLLLVPTNPFARMRTYPSKNPSTGNYYLNNIPLVPPVDVLASNGVIHHTAVLVRPPSSFLWTRINADADLTILKAGIERADSGYTVTTPGSLIGALQNFGANLTVFAPNNAAMKNFISLITGGAIPTAAPDAVFIGFLNSANVTTRLVKGIIVYHILGKRAYTVNIPTTPFATPTLLNGAVAAHPGLVLTATFTGPFVSALTVKGLGNATASNVLINSAPNGSSDQNYINGTLHKIDQVLRPQ